MQSSLFRNACIFPHGTVPTLLIRKQALTFGKEKSKILQEDYVNVTCDVTSILYNFLENKNNKEGRRTDERRTEQSHHGICGLLSG